MPRRPSSGRSLLLGALVALVALVATGCDAWLGDGSLGGGQGAYQPGRSFNVRVWTNYSSDGFVFPELAGDDWGMPDLQAKPDVGIALGGGGFRAAIMSLGWIRGLHKLGLLGKTRYVSSCSGASWFNAAFSFADVPLDAFLGTYVPPEKLPLASLKWMETGPKSIGRVMSNANFVTSGAVVGPWWARKQLTWWDEVVGREFLEPYGIGDKQSFFTFLGTRGRVHEHVLAQFRGEIPVYIGGKESRPYPVMVVTVLREADSRQFFPFEFTPLYVGSPPLHATPNSRLPPIGGGYVEPLGFNSPPPRNVTPWAGFGAPRFARAAPSWLVPLVGWSGVASGWLSQNNKPQWEVTQTILAQNWYDYWNLENFKGGPTKFVDGGAIDLQALMPLLRRGVRNVIVCIPSWVEPTMPIKQWARLQFDISSLFGVVEPGTNKTITVADSLYPKMMQVFPSDEWPRFFARYRSLYQAARTPIFKMKLKVLRNDFHGIRGGYEANVLWVMNGRDAEWEARLPPSTQAYLNASRLVPLHPLGKFPLVETFRPDAPSELVTMLGQMMSWQMLRVAPELREMFGQGPGSGASGGGGAKGGGSSSVAKGSGISGGSSSTSGSGAGSSGGTGRSGGQRQPVAG